MRQTPSQKQFIRAVARINQSVRRARMLQSLIRREFVAGPWLFAKQSNTWDLYLHEFNRIAMANA